MSLKGQVGELPDVTSMMNEEELEDLLFTKDETNLEGITNLCSSQDVSSNSVVQLRKELKHLDPPISMSEAHYSTSVTAKTSIVSTAKKVKRDSKVVLTEPSFEVHEDETRRTPLVERRIFMNPKSPGIDIQKKNTEIMLIIRLKEGWSSITE